MRRILALVMALVIGLIVTVPTDYPVYAEERLIDEINEACPTHIPFYVKQGYSPRVKLTLGPRWVEGGVEVPTHTSTWIEWATYYGKLIDAASHHVFALQDIMSRVVRTCYLVKEGGFTHDQAYALLEIFWAIDYRSSGEDRWGTKPWQN